MILLETACQPLQDLGAISGPPQEHLADCLDRSPNPPGPGDVHDPTNQAQTLLEIRERFRHVLYLCSADQLAFLKQAAGSQQEPVPLTQDMAAAMMQFRSLFFVFLFYHQESYHLVLPVELVKLLKQALADPAFLSKNARNLERSRYVKALAVLCGAYEVDQFVAVWNQHHAEKITPQKARIFLDELAAFDRSFTVIGDELFDQVLDPYEARNLLNATFDKPCSLPGQELIQQLAQTGYDPGDRLARQALKAVIAPLLPHPQALDDLMVQLALDARRILDPEQTMQLLKQNQLPVHDPAFVQAFETHYDRWQRTIHVWELRGHTRNQITLITGEPFFPFHLPKHKRKSKGAPGPFQQPDQ